MPVSFTTCPFFWAASFRLILYSPTIEGGVFFFVAPVGGPLGPMAGVSVRCRSFCTRIRALWNAGKGSVLCDSPSKRSARNADTTIAAAAAASASSTPMALAGPPVIAPSANCGDHSDDVPWRKWQ